MAQSLALLETKNLPAPGIQAPGALAPGAKAGFKLFGDDGFTFDDLLDIVNPLHHLPVVGFIYRAVTGDTISPASRITGGALFGGPLGLAASVADTMLKEASGRDVGGHLLSLVKSNDTEELLPRIELDNQEDPIWETASALRHDANEFEDWRPLASEPQTPQAAVAAKAHDLPGRGVTTASLRYGDIHADYPEDTPSPETPEKAATVAATAAPAAVAAQASTAPRTVIGR